MHGLMQEPRIGLTDWAMSFKDVDAETIVVDSQQARQFAVCMDL
jgi:hypothetical protein